MIKNIVEKKQLFLCNIRKYSYFLDKKHSIFNQNVIAVLQPKNKNMRILKIYIRNFISYIESKNLGYYLVVFRISDSFHQIIDQNSM